MGVELTTYLMFAVDLSDYNIDMETIAKECEGHPERRFDVVFDAAWGKYLYAGKILGRIDPHDDKAVMFDLHDLGRLWMKCSILSHKISKATGIDVDPDSFKIMLIPDYY
ncbi:hypothetical protein EVB91_194 [Rhizobium phage RHph_I1_18]|nr:hypothetical protein EVB91_194 [Rhizobium phage RHph_I1_18]